MARMNIVNWPRFTGTCPRCGRPTNEGARFCRACGQRLITNVPEPTPVAEQTREPEPRDVPATQDVQPPAQNQREALDWRVIAFVAGLTAVIGLIIRSLIRMFV